MRTQTDTLERRADGAKAISGSHRYGRLVPSARTGKLAGYVLAAGFVALAWLEQWRLLTRLLTRYLNADNSLLWFAAREWSRLHVPEPTFYGQSYGVTFEAIPTAILHALGIDYTLALPLALFLLAWGAWLCLALGALRRHMPLAALIALAAPSLLSIKHWIVVGVIGTGAGRLLAAVCAALVLAGGSRRRHAFAVVTLGGLAVAFDTACALLVGPALVWAGLGWLRTRRLWLPAVLGLLAPLAWIGLNHWFTQQHPDHDYHQTWSFTPEWAPLLHNFHKPNQLLGVQALELLRYGGTIPIALALLVCFGLGVGAWREAAAVSCVLLQLVYLAALSKSLDDNGTLWYPAARMTLTLPMATWFVATLSLRACWLRLGPRRHAWTRRAELLVATALVALVSTSASVRALRWDERMSVIEERAMETKFLPQTRPWIVRAICEQAQRAAADFGTSIVAFPTEHVANYACPAFYPELTTVYPRYERRYWILDQLTRTPERRMILWGKDARICGRSHIFTECHAVAHNRAVAMAWNDRNPLQVLRMLGFTIRPFGPGCWPKHRETCTWWNERYTRASAKALQKLE